MPARPPPLVALAALAAFVVLLVLVAGDWPPLDRADAAFSEALRAAGTARPRLVTAARLVTDVAATLPYALLGLAATATLHVRGHRRPAAFCAVVTVAVPALWGLMHWLVHHPRPVDGHAVVTSNSFPSGHTSHAAALALAGVLLGWPVLGRLGRALAVAAAIGYAVGIGATRVVLLVHWPSDVLGGWLLATGVVVAAAHWTRPHHRRGLSSARPAPGRRPCRR
ncbi:MAG TPA: phosphatase PAP2 family protein [Pilimelia sp.]|nr:phosphatase PAP2 family protein [Pilimelia sp.]